MNRGLIGTVALQQGPRFGPTSRADMTVYIFSPCQRGFPLAAQSDDMQIRIIINPQLFIHENVSVAGRLYITAM